MKLFSLFIISVLKVECCTREMCNKSETSFIIILKILEKLETGRYTWYNEIFNNPPINGEKGNWMLAENFAQIFILAHIML